MIKRVPTSIFVSKEEAFAVVQLFGISKTSGGILQEFLKMLGDKYGYDWTTCEIAPSGEVIQVVQDKNDRDVGVGGVS